MGDGLLGTYGVHALLDDEHVRNSITSSIVCSPDPVGAWGAARLLDEKYGLAPSLMAGQVTDNAVGLRFCHDRLGVPTWNALTDPPAKALEILAQAQELAPDNVVVQDWVDKLNRKRADAWLHQAINLEGQGEYEAALEAYVKALEHVLTRVIETTRLRRQVSFLQRSGRGDPDPERTAVSARMKEVLELARRTVAKYRKELGLPSSYRRRRY